MTTDSLVLEYDRMWINARDKLLDNDVTPDPSPTEGGNRWGVSIIFRPGGAVLGRLVDVCGEMSASIGTENIIYKASNLHTTVFSIGNYRENISSDSGALSEYELIVQEAVRQIGVFQHRYCGLTASTSGVLAQGFPNGKALGELRNRISDSFKGRRIAAYEMGRVRSLSHASLAVFTQALSAPQQLVQYIDRNRNRDFGEFTVSELEIVSYQRSSDNVAIVSHCVIPMK